MRNSSGPVDCINQYDSYLDTQQQATCHVCLSTGAVVGLSFHAQMGLISLVALLALLGIIARNYRRNLINPPARAWRLFRGNVDILMLNLIFADILMSFGAISDIYWAHKRQVFCGSYCNAQGVLQTMGETAAALSTLSVAIYTFMAVYRNRYPTYRPWLCLAVVASIWAWVLLWAVIPLARNGAGRQDSDGNVLDFYTPTPWWCWINQKYMPERVVAEYLWLWIAGIGSIGLYVPSYFTVRNQNNNTGADDGASIASSINENNEAGKMLWYPLAYTFCVLPLSIMRWTGFVNHDLKNSDILSPSMVFSSIFNLMGIINVSLLLWTRPAILLIGSNGVLRPGDPRAESMDNLNRDVPLAPRRTSDESKQQVEAQHGRLNASESERQSSNRFSGANVQLPRDI